MRALLDVLLGIPGEEHLSRARDGLDELYRTARLPERDYVSAVSRMNKLLGSESPEYAAMKKRQAADRLRVRQQAEVEAKQQLQGAFEAELARHGSAEGISGHVAALDAFGGGAKRNFPRTTTDVGSPSRGKKPAGCGFFGSLMSTKPSPSNSLSE